MSYATLKSKIEQMIEKIQSGGNTDNADFIALIERTATEVTIPNGITKIGNYLFYNYADLVTADIPDTVTEIGAGAYRMCRKLELTEIPASVKTIGLYSFGGCTSLTEITFKGTPTSLNANIFTDSTNLTVINVPWAEGEVANAPWAATNATINYNYTGV